MPVSYVLNKLIREEMKKLTKSVKLRVFLDKNKKAPQNYDYTLSILNVYEENSNGMLTIESLLVGKNPNLDKKYDIQRVPTILFIDNNGNEIIRYLAAPQGSEVQPFIEALLILAGAPNCYEAVIKKNLNRITPSTIKVMITNSCTYCPQMVRIVSQFAIASGGIIKAVIIDIMENPDLGQIYNVCSVPHTVINEEITLVGVYEPDDIIKEIIGENMRI